jgi:hypothetical protein
VASVRYRIGRAHTQQGVLFAAPFSRHALWARLYSVSGFTGGPCFALSGRSCVSRNYCYTVANWNAPRCTTRTVSQAVHGEILPYSRLPFGQQLPAETRRMRW